MPTYNLWLVNCELCVSANTWNLIALLFQDIYNGTQENERRLLKGRVKFNLTIILRHVFDFKYIRKWLTQFFRHRLPENVKLRWELDLRGLRWIWSRIQIIVLLLGKAFCRFIQARNYRGKSDFIWTHRDEWDRPPGAYVRSYLNGGGGGGYIHLPNSIGNRPY